MTTIIIQERLDALQETEALEAACYRTAVIWGPTGGAAQAARTALASVEHEQRAAKSDFDVSIGVIGERDRELADEFARLAAAGALTVESVGEGGGPLITAVIRADVAATKAAAGVVKARAKCSDAHQASARLWGDVLRAVDALRAQSSEVLGQSVARIIIGASGGLSVSPPISDCDGVLQRCREQLKALGAKD